MLKTGEVGRNILSIFLSVTWLLYLGPRHPRELQGVSLEISNIYTRSDKDKSRTHIVGSFLPRAPYSKISLPRFDFRTGHLACSEYYEVLQGVS